MQLVEDISSFLAVKYKHVEIFNYEFERGNLILRDLLPGYKLFEIALNTK